MFVYPLVIYPSSCSYSVVSRRHLGRIGVSKRLWKTDSLDTESSDRSRENDSQKIAAVVESIKKVNADVWALSHSLYHRFVAVAQIISNKTSSMVEKCVDNKTALIDDILQCNNGEARGWYR